MGKVTIGGVEYWESECMECGMPQDDVDIIQVTRDIVLRMKKMKATGGAARNVEHWARQSDGALTMLLQEIEAMDDESEN